MTKTPSPPDKATAKAQEARSAVVARIASEVESSERLSEQELKFVAAVVSHGDIPRAAVEADYGAGTASSRAYAWLNPESKFFKPALYEAVMTSRIRALVKTETQYEVTAARVLLELARLAFVNVKDFDGAYDADGNLDLKKLTHDQAAAISELTIETVGKGDKAKRRVRAKLWSKTEAINTLARHLGLLKPDAAQVNVNVTLEQLIVASLVQPAATIVIDKPDGEIKS